MLTKNTIFYTVDNEKLILRIFFHKWNKKTKLLFFSLWFWNYSIDEKGDSCLSFSSPILKLQVDSTYLKNDSKFLWCCLLGTSSKITRSAEKIVLWLQNQIWPLPYLITLFMTILNMTVLRSNLYYTTLYTRFFLRKTIKITVKNTTLYYHLILLHWIWKKM